MSSTGKKAFISDSDFVKLLDVFNSVGAVYIPCETVNREGVSVYHYEKRAVGEPFTAFGYRPVEPLKTFLFSGRSKVAEYPSETASDDSPVSADKFFIIGAAACDIVSLKSLDAVFLQDEFTDIFYQAKRDAAFIVTQDCTEPRETCFCTLAGDAPWPTGGFDLNISIFNSGYIIESGSEKGEKAMSDNGELFTYISDAQADIVAKKRAEVKRSVELSNKEFELAKGRRELLEAHRESTGWYEQVENCVECGACLFSCPTCHCFLLHDQAGGGEGSFERVKKWDACVYSGFSRMSGGSSPRLGLMERFRHRYLHKLEYFPENFDFEACTGCGRCIDGCMGEIDMRKVLKAIETVSTGAV